MEKLNKIVYRVGFIFASVLVIVSTLSLLTEHVRFLVANSILFTGQLLPNLILFTLDFIDILARAFFAAFAILLFQKTASNIANNLRAAMVCVMVVFVLLITYVRMPSEFVLAYQPTLIIFCLLITLARSFDKR